VREGRLIVFILFFVALVMLVWSWPPTARGEAQTCSSLFLSEYVEGSGFNKGVEIFNGLGHDVNLDGYAIWIYRNGGAEPDKKIALSGTLSSGDTFILAHSAAEFLDLADLLSSDLNFNGDDGVALMKDEVVIDFLGDTLGDPGAQWGGGDTGTKDHTLRRKSWVFKGDANTTDAFDPATEWDGFAKDVFDGLGWHIADCVEQTPVSSSTVTLTKTLTPTGTTTSTITATITMTPTSSSTATMTPTPTPVNTVAPTPTSTLPPSGIVMLNEILPAPKNIDFDGDGAVNSADEYVELYNTADVAMDIGGWWLDDNEAGSVPYLIKAGTIIDAHGFVLLFHADTGVALNNDGDKVRLLAPDGHTVMDEMSYEASHYDAAWSRTIDGGGVWTEEYEPSPGGPNQPPPSTPTPAPPGLIMLNEILPSPKNIDFDGDGKADFKDEFIELFNSQAVAIDVGGWWLDDLDGGSPPYQIPLGMRIEPRGFLVFFRSETGIALNNDGDEARLLNTAQQVMDAFSFPWTGEDRAWSRSEDGAGVWTNSYPPSPGKPNVGPTPTLTPLPSPAPGQVSLNEILPAPQNYDWDGDGEASADDEWIELYNRTNQTFTLAGWRLWGGQLGDDGLPTGWYYEFPDDAILAAHDFLVVFGRKSNIRLSNNGGVIHVVMPEENSWRVVESFAWDHSPGYDRSFSRYPDGSGDWDVRAVTPGQPNAPLPTPPPPPPATPVPPTPAPAFGPPQPIANAYLAPPKTYITLIGAVTVAPGDFSRRLLFIQDDSGGIMVYLWRGEYPALHVGDQVQVQGRLKDYHGQRELVLRNASALTLLGKGPQPQPQFVRTGQVTDGLMGRLLLVAGRVRNVRKYSFELDDGSGSVRIEHPYKAPWQLPALQPGMTVSVMGVVARYKDSLHILPRSPQDISPPPGVLPTTGGKN